MATVSDSSAEALFGRTRRGVLGLLFGRPGESFYLREIVRLVGGGSGAIQRELGRLTEAGIIRRELRGRQVYFGANPESPIYPELIGLLAKTSGIADVLREVLRPLAEAGSIAVAFIYGSVAAGNHAAASDLDLMVVGSTTLSKLVPALRRAQEQIGREVNPTLYAEQEFVNKIAADAHFVQHVIAGPTLMVIGDANEFARMVGKPLDRLA